MAFDGFEKIPAVNPLLVRLYDTHTLYSLASGADAQARQELTDVMIDLLSIPLSAKEGEIITDVLIGLMKKAESDLKAALSDRLSAMPQIPLRMVLALANEEIAVAEPVLRKSPMLHDMDLIYIVQARGVSHARAVARRPSMGQGLIDMLAELYDVETAINLCENRAINLSERAFGIFEKMAETDSRIARPLVVRDDLPQKIAQKLYAHVGVDLKRALADKMGHQADVAIQTLNEVMLEMVEARIPEDGDVMDRYTAAARYQMERGELKMPSMIAALRRGQYSTFTGQAVIFFDLPLAVTMAVLKQKGGTSLAVACKAMDVSKADFISLYLLTERFRSRERRVIGHDELSRMMTAYDAIDQERALHMLNDSRG